MTRAEGDDAAQPLARQQVFHLVILRADAAVHVALNDHNADAKPRPIERFEHQQLRAFHVQFSDGAEVVIGLSPDKAAILAAVKNLRQDKGGTNTRAGFLKAKSILDTSHCPGSAGQIVIIGAVAQ